MQMQQLCVLTMAMVAVAMVPLAADDAPVLKSAATECAALGAAWNYTTCDVSAWAADTRRAASVLNADSDDLSAFRTRQGKLLLWHGWADPALNAQSTVHYCERLRRRDLQVADCARLFLRPGVLHCDGGAGPDSVEWIDAIAAWTERGAAPDRGGGQARR